MVKPRLARYATEKGSRSFDIRCLIWFIGPMRTEKLDRFETMLLHCTVELRNSPNHHKEAAKAAEQRNTIRRSDLRGRRLFLPESQCEFRRP